MSSSTKNSNNLDFDQEARELWAKLNLDPNSRRNGQWNPLDSIWRHPTGGGTIYVGNQTAAENINLLRSHEITHVVNCTFGESKIPNFHTGKLNYYNFPVSHWQGFLNNSHTSVLAFTAPLFEFIEGAVARGESVLIHCLAGAHRAGTTGVACLIHFAHMDVPTAILTAKTCRPIIDPIGQLPEFLLRLKRAEDAAAALVGDSFSSSKGTDTIEGFLSVKGSSISEKTNKK
eukprot:gene15806-21410_t